MSLVTTSEKLSKIWSALSSKPGRLVDLSDTWRTVAREGWIIEINLEDTLLAMDSRLDRAGLKAEDFTEMLGLPWRAIFARPRSRFDDPHGFSGLAASDTAALLILLERLGFSADATLLCDLLRPSLLQSRQLTEAQLDALFHNKSALRTPPLTISAAATDFFGLTTKKVITPRGYRIEYSENANGAPLWLTVKAPKYRSRPTPTLTTCEECGVTYVKGLPSDDLEHRRTHRLRRQATHPEPNRRFAMELKKNPLDACWVDEWSSEWKHELMYRRAYAFKREAGYDFVQWGFSARENRGAVGYLFGDADGRIVGAAGFRPENGERPWRLDWVWMAPAYRRAGLLAGQWNAFRQRFGEFDVEHPLSDAMKAFLMKHGAAHLIR